MNKQPHDLMDRQIELLDDLLAKAYQKDPELKVLIDHSRHINNPEMIETLRTLLVAKDFEDVKKILLSL